MDATTQLRESENKVARLRETLVRLLHNLKAGPA